MSFKPFAIGANLAVSRQALDAVGGFCESLHRGGDMDFSWRVQLAGYPLYHDPSMDVANMRFRQYSVELPNGLIATYSDLKRAVVCGGWFPLVFDWRNLLGATAMNYGRWQA